jgi:hypothetical protein
VNKQKKEKMRNQYYISQLFFILCFFTTIVMVAETEAEEVEILEIYSDMSYLKQSDGNMQFTVVFTFDGEEDTEAVSNVPVSFYTNEDEPVKIAEVYTDMTGTAVLRIAPDYKFPLNYDGYFYIKAVFDGNEKFEGSESEISYIDISLDLSFDEIEGKKYIVAKAYKLNKSGGIEEINDEDVFFYVPRMFTRLPIGSGYLEEGKALLEFPTELPGDTIGKVTVVARIEDHSVFGNVEKISSVKWGIEKINTYSEDHRALWTEIAPKWMMITLMIMLSGVWGHYIYTIGQLFKLKKDA